MNILLRRSVLFAAACSAVVYAQSPAASCSSTLSASYSSPSVAPGYVARLVANDLTDPRGIKFDSAGNLLVVESGVGITALDFDDNGGGCVSVGSRKTVVSDTTLNHGIEISQDGSQLFASNPEAVYRWDYSSTKQANTSAPTTLVTNMTNSDHTTRTLLLSKFAPGVLVVTRGSTSNIDPLASNVHTGHAQVKAFNLTNITSTAYDFTTQGLLLGWGLRNDVGIDEEPITGRIYSVENSVDQMTRNGKDIHQTNPAEELNFLGYLNGTSSTNQGRNFGYPQCYTAWDVSTIPDFDGTVGEQFAIGELSKTNSDAMCSEAERQAPRLGFHPHMAPLDILFNDAGTEAWVSFHGSWDSNPPIGYKVSLVEFVNGEPVQPSTSNTAAIDIVSNHDLTKCPKNCFRPAGLAWDREGRLFFSSDATGEIYMVLRDDGKAVNSASNVTGGGNGTGSATTNAASSGLIDKQNLVSVSVFVVVIGALLLLS